jgi:hypothetical protein
MKMIRLIAWIALVALAVASLWGCGGQSRGEYRGDSKSTTIATPEMTVTINEKHGHSSAAQTTPPNAKQQSPLKVDADGASTSTSGTWETKAVDYTKKYAASIFYSAAGLSLIGGALALWKRKWMLGACLLGACAIAAAVPSLIGFLAWLVAGIIILVLIGGVWFVAQFIRDHNRLQEAAPGFAKLVKEGQSNAAIAAIRAVEPRLDKAFSTASAR